jgi:hypothetical protein
MGGQRSRGDESMIVRRGLGQVIPNASGFSDLQSFLDAAAAANGVSVCRSGTYTGCPNIPLFQSVISEAENAWFNRNATAPVAVAAPAVSAPVAVAPAPVIPIRGSSSVPANRGVTPAPRIPPIIPAAPAAPLSAAPPAANVGQTNAAGGAASGTVDTSATSTGFDFSSLPWYVWAGGAALLLFVFKGKG